MTGKIPRDAYQPLYSAIGETIMNWTIVENAVNFQVAIIFQSAGGRHLEKVLPYNLGRKTKFLRRCYNKLTTLKPFASDGLALINRLNRIKSTRDVLVHGTVSGYSPTSHTFHFTLIELDKAKTMQVVREISLPVSKILDDSGDAMSIGRDKLKLSTRLLDTLVPDYEGKALLHFLAD